MTNKVFLIGNLTRDPEMYETSTGTAVCKFSIAVNRSYTNADGERDTDFFNIVAWRGLGENCGKYLQKGTKVAIVGSLQNRSWEDDDGNTRRATDIIASEVEFLTRSNSEEEEKPAKKTKKEAPKKNKSFKEIESKHDIEDDFPF